MRGKGVDPRDKRVAMRITPAYAGKRCGARLAAGHRGDHPRVCGEKAPFQKNVYSGEGSPPRMRGKVTGFFGLFCLNGITPAYAGKRFLHVDSLIVAVDHPRVCGEKEPPTPGASKHTGSPPRMRGKGILSSVATVRTGITPAYAGKRLKRSHSIGHFSCILCLFHSVLHRASASGGSRAGPCAPPCLPAQNAVPV